MADVCKFVTAAEPALGWERGTFLKTYEAYRKAAKMAALEASIFGYAVYEALTEDEERKQTVKVQGKAEWKCTATDLLDAVTVKAANFDRKNFPKSPRAVSGALRRLAPSLKEFGIVVELPESAERINGVVQRQITFTWLKSPQAGA